MADVHIVPTSDDGEREESQWFRRSRTTDVSCITMSKTYADAHKGRRSGVAFEDSIELFGDEMEPATDEDDLSEYLDGFRSREPSPRDAEDIIQTSNTTAIPPTSNDASNDVPDRGPWSAKKGLEGVYVNITHTPASLLATGPLEPLAASLESPDQDVDLPSSPCDTTPLARKALSESGALRQGLLASLQRESNMGVVAGDSSELSELSDAGGGDISRSEVARDSPKASNAEGSTSRASSHDSDKDDAENDADATITDLNRRSLRPRTVAQINPYSFEHALYAKTLHKNGWDGAIVKFPKRIELSAEDLKRRQAEHGRDNLNGWLDFEEEQEMFKTSSDSRLLSESSEAHPLSSNGIGELSGPSSSLLSSHMHSLSQQDMYQGTPEYPYPVSSSPSTSDHIPAPTRRPARVVLSGSSDMASDASDSSSGEESSVAQRSTKKKRRRRDTSVLSENERESRLKMTGKKKKMLSRMMPAVFMRRAEQDLHLMEEEVEVVKNTALMSRTIHVNSSDGETIEEQKGKGKKRMSDHSRPFFFQDGVFTDESDDEYEEDMVTSLNAVDATSSDSELEVDAVENWLESFAPRKKSRNYQMSKIDRLLNYNNDQRHKKAKKAKESAKARAKKGQRRMGLTSFEVDHQRQKSYDRAQEVVGDRADKTHSVPAFLRQKKIYSSTTIDRFLQPFDEKQRAENDEKWSSLTKFSHDFHIEKLQLGFVFKSNSYIGSAQLFSMIEPTTNKECVPVFAFGLNLHSNLDLESFLATIPQLCDALFNWVQSDGPSVTESWSEVTLPLRFTALYVITHTGSLQDNMINVILTQLEQLNARVSGFAKKYLLRIAWVLWSEFETLSRLLHNLPQRTTFSDSLKNALYEVTRRLVRTLIQYGPEQTSKKLNQLRETSDEVDSSIEIWVCLLNFCLARSEPTSFINENDLWEIIKTEIEGFFPDKTKNVIVVCESMSFLAMLLCKLSQFSATGVSSSEPRLPPYWNMMIDAIETINLRETNLSNTMLVRRDRYVWCLFARCLVFIDRWAWSMGLKDALLRQFLDILQASRFSNLSIEQFHLDFPHFIREPSDFKTLEFDPKNDTMFEVFLKIIFRAVYKMDYSSETDLNRQLSRFALRLAPITAVTQSASTSAIINHYSLYLMLYIISPLSANKHMDDARHLVDFPHADADRRVITIRAIVCFFLQLKFHRKSLKPICEWLASIVAVLKDEYMLLKREATVKGMGSATVLDTANPLYQRATHLAMVLRSMQHILKSSSGSFPDLTMLNEAWTTKLLDSSFTLDHMIDSEIMNLFNVVLDIRFDLVSVRPPTKESNTSISQDEFGLFDIDYMDPALNAMLGQDQGKDQRDVEDETSLESSIKEGDKSLALMIRSSISPALFNHISKIFLQNINRRSPLVLAARDEYVKTVVDCWARCIAVEAENDVADWGSYLRYGDLSWRRISDPIGRRDVGLVLAIGMLKYDMGLFAIFADEVLEIWFQAIVASRITNQYDLTHRLREMEPPFFLFEHVDHVYDVLDDDTTVRLKILRDVFGQIRLTLFSNVKNANLEPYKTMFSKHIQEMVKSMQENVYYTIDPEERETYYAFCRGVVALLKETVPIFYARQETNITKLLGSIS